MSHLLQVYRAHYRITMVRYMTYRVELVIWLFQLILRPVVFLVVWASAARAMGGTLRGFTPSQFAAYFIVAMLVHHAAVAWTMFEWEPRVKNGHLSYLLLRPSHVIHRDIGENLTFKLATLPVMLTTAVGLALAFRPEWNFQPWALLAAVPVMILAMALYFAVAWIVAMAAFYTTQIDAINAVLFFTLLLFSGQMAPVSLMPPAIQAVARALPFYWHMGFPVELILGRLTPAQVVQGMGMQVLWLAVCASIMALLWRRGLKTYTAVGI